MSKSDILKGTTSFLNDTIGMLTFVAFFICMMNANFTTDSDDFSLLLRAHKWIPNLLFISSLIGWIFYGIYGSKRMEWYEHEEDHILSYTLWYMWHILSFSWVLYWPCVFIIKTCKFIFYDFTIGIIRFIAGPQKKKVQKTITEQYDTLLRR